MEVVEIVEDDVVVEPVNELQEIKTLLLEMKADIENIKEVTKSFADGNADLDVELKEKRKLAQDIDKAV